jgi:hypothetical protein
MPAFVHYIGIDYSGAHGQKREWSWRSPINGFRIDHAFAIASFLKTFAVTRLTIILPDTGSLAVSGSDKEGYRR